MTREETAFKIMREMCWWTVPCVNGKEWIVRRGVPGEGFEPFGLPECYPDPVTAILETRRKYEIGEI